MSLSIAFTKFFASDYCTAARLFSEFSSHNTYAGYHYALARFLSERAALDNGIPVEVIALEALRQEIYFRYTTALHLWEVAISFQTKQISQISSLTICDISARINPLSQIPLHLLETCDPDSISLSLSSMAVERLLSLVGQIVRNSNAEVIPRDLVQFGCNLLSKLIATQPSIDNYCKAGHFYFLVGDYEKADFFYNQAEALYGITPLLLYRKSELAFRTNNLCQGINLLEQAIKLDPNNPQYISEYGITLDTYGMREKAGELMLRAFSLINSSISYHVGLANRYRRFGAIKLATKFYYLPTKVIPLYGNICYYLAHFAYSNNQIEEAKKYCKFSVTAIPVNSSCIILLSELLERSSKTEESVSLLEKVYDQFCYSYNFILNLIEKLTKLKKILRAIEVCHDFLRLGSHTFKFRCLTLLARLYLDVGLTIPLLKTLDDIQALLIEHSDRGTSWQEWMFLYHRLTFIVPSIRDNPFFNCLLFSLVSEKYIIRLWEWRKVVAKLYNFNFEAVRRYNHKLRRIAFISPNFTGHVVSILSIDIITELSSLYGDLEVMLIPTDPNYKESKFMEVVRRREQVRIVDLDNYNLASIAVTLAKLDLDVLIELDGATSISACPLLYCRPALINMSWLGFDAPFISPCNYFLCDRYTHPPEFDEIYVEKLVRLPHSHMCVSGFEVAEKDRDEIRTSLGISQDQVVFIYTAAVRKFNFDTAAAHAQILKRSPKSVLLVKTSLGTLDKPLEVWQQELQSVGVSTDRLIPMQYASTQEEHRFYFKVADIYLDAYPYNGGSQTLEALWCELPVVTLCGQQSFARMGYSLLSTLGITDGIAHSWEEYVEWAVRLATDKELYQKIKHRLWEAKQPATLSPLWNPKQFARDMYNILQDLYTQEVQGRGS